MLKCLQEYLQQKTLKTQNCGTVIASIFTSACYNIMKILIVQRHSVFIKNNLIYTIYSLYTVMIKMLHKIMTYYITLFQNNSGFSAAVIMIVWFLLANIMITCQIIVCVLYHILYYF